MDQRGVVLQLVGILQIVQITPAEAAAEKLPSTFTAGLVSTGFWLLLSPKILEAGLVDDLRAKHLRVADLYGVLGGLE